MSETASVSTGIASRYAVAIFELAKEGKALDALTADVDALEAALDGSEDFRKLIHSPIYSRDDQKAAVTAVAKKAGVSDTLTNALGLMANKRRLFVLPQLLTALKARMAAERGEVEAEVISAQALTDAQRANLSEKLASTVGKKIKLSTAVDESLIGGLVVKVGSQMIDTSVRSKLAALKNTMKEVR